MKTMLLLMVPAVAVLGLPAVDPAAPVGPQFTTLATVAANDATALHTLMDGSVEFSLTLPEGVWTLDSDAAGVRPVSGQPA